jgi:hypothetical protein
VSVGPTTASNTYLMSAASSAERGEAFKKYSQRLLFKYFFASVYSFGIREYGVKGSPSSSSRLVKRVIDVDNKKRE